MSRIRTIAHNLRLIFSSKIAVQMGEIEHRLNLRADGYENAIDMRFDERFERLERRIEERLEAHERRTDECMWKSRAGTVERTDLMLQIFEQRLDQQRREIRAMREALAAVAVAAKNSAQSNVSSGFETQPAPSAPGVPEPNRDQSPAERIPSFRRLAENADWRLKQSLQSDGQGGSALYQCILEGNNAQPTPIEWEDDELAQSQEGRTTDPV